MADTKNTKSGGNSEFRFRDKHLRSDTRKPYQPTATVEGMGLISLTGKEISQNGLTARVPTQAEMKKMYEANPKFWEKYMIPPDGYEK